LKHRQLEVLLVLLRSKVTARQHQDQRITALELTELANYVCVVREGVIGKDSTCRNVRAHMCTHLFKPNVAATRPRRDLETRFRSVVQNRWLLSDHLVLPLLRQRAAALLIDLGRASHMLSRIAMRPVCRLPTSIPV
jgi:hypothetical protein